MKNELSLTARIIIAILFIAVIIGGIILIEKHLDKLLGIVLAFLIIIGVVKLW